MKLFFSKITGLSRFAELSFGGEDRRDWSDRLMSCTIRKYNSGFPCVSMHSSLLNERYFLREWCSRLLWLCFRKSCSLFAIHHTLDSMQRSVMKLPQARLKKLLQTRKSFHKFISSSSALWLRNKSQNIPLDFISTTLCNCLRNVFITSVSFFYLYAQIVNKMIQFSLEIFEMKFVSKMFTNWSWDHFSQFKQTDLNCCS